MNAGLRRGALGVLCSFVLLGATLAEAPVADAAMRGDVDAVRQLLRDGADVNAAQGDGMSAMHWAAERGDVELMDVLLYAGAKVDVVTRIGEYTPLHVAARNGHVNAVTKLLEAGADIEAVTVPAGTTPIHVAASGGSSAVLEALIAGGADVNAREGEYQQTPLIFAASFNRLDAVNALLAAGADPNLAAESTDLLAMQPLDNAARQRQRQVLDAFTNEGKWQPTSAQIQAAVRASRQVYEQGLDEDEEIEEDDSPFGGRNRTPNITSHGGLTPLLHAARQGNIAVMEALIAAGADVDLVGGGDGTTPLLISTINGQFDAAMLLLGEGADPNIASELNGVTPLWATVNSEWQPRTRFPQPQQREKQSVGYLEVMEALLDAGADPNARTTMHPWYMVYTGCGNGNCGLIDTKGATAFLRAAYATDVDAMRLLHARGADPEIATIAPERRQRRSPDEFQRQFALDQLKSNTEWEERGDSSKVVLVRSVWDRLPDSVKVEITEEQVNEDPAGVRDDVIAHAERQDSAKAAEPDPSGLPPVEAGGPGVFALHAAAGVGYGEGFAGNAHRHAENGWMPSVKFLIEEIGMDVNIRDFNGYTAMHHAAARGDNEMIHYLVEQGGDVTVVSRRGQSTADMANAPVSRLSPFPATIDLLVSLGAINNNNCTSCQ